jgi:DNA (cytosine-5)-methyltransferase 1
MMLTFGSLFAGIGGFDLGFERAGMQCKWQVEIDPYCQRVLAKHWPDVRRHDDVRTFPPGDAEEWRVDVICGGFPCQDVSVAGKREGIGGERSGLWSEYLRIICQLRPRFVVVENVAGLLSDGMGTVLGDLASAGFDAEWQVLRASQFGARHKRSRVFIVAYANGDGLEGWRVLPPKAHVPTLDQVRNWPHVPEPFGIRSRHGVPAFVDRISGLGNAVVPQVAQWIGERIVKAVQ